jgi:moderate conductance mechanosensitive channel
MPALNYTTIGGVLLVFAIAAIAVRVATSLVHRTLNALDIVGADNRTAVHARAKQLTRALMVLAYGVAALASVSLALARLGISDPDWNPRQLTRWLLTHGVNLVIIAIGAFVAVRVANLAIDHLEFKIARRYADGDLEWKRRAATLSGILTSVVTFAVVFTGGLMVLRELSIDVLPILTGAGIAGLAIGFGAQNLVRDVISGFFLILEDQVRIGDLVRINGVAGIVEQINLRTLVLRDGDGAVQVFPSGTITTLANLSKQYAYATVDVRIAYGENVDRVLAAIRNVGVSMESDKVFAPLVLAPLEILGIESLADGAATIRMKFRVHPLNQGKVANELRRRLLIDFVGLQIRPFSG